jgi:hypothetical protein
MKEDTNPSLASENALKSNVDGLADAFDELIQSRLGGKPASGRQPEIEQSQDDARSRVTGLCCWATRRVPRRRLK